MEGFDTPNVAQMETVARDYSSPVIDWARKPGEYSDESTNGYAFWATLASGTRVLVGRYGAVLREEVAPLFPMALMRYATERGYPGMPTVGAVKFDGHDWGASIFDGESLTVDVVSQLAHCHAEWVCVHWRDAGIAGISADFKLSELLPTGLRACGIDHPAQMESAPLCAHCGKPGAISEAHLDPSGESRCRTCLLASYGAAMREVAEYEPEILDDVHDSYAECGTPVDSSNLAGWRDHSRLCALRSVYEGAGTMAENGETGDAYASLENAVGAYLRGADAPSITSAGFVS